MPTPPDRSLSAHARSVLQKDREQQRARDAAAACRAFLDAPLRIRTDDVRGQAAFAVLLACMAYGAEMSRG